MDNKNIVLIGMRGSGKSTIAKALSKKLNRPFLDTDELIIEKAQKSVTEIVTQFGWPHFRQLESELIQEISHLEGHIISTGGGVPLDPANTEALKQNGKIIYLKVDPEILDQRIKGKEDDDRPALNPTKSSKEILSDRQEIYEQAADITFDANEDDLEGKAEKLSEIID